MLLSAAGGLSPLTPVGRGGGGGPNWGELSKVVGGTFRSLALLHTATHQELLDSPRLRRLQHPNPNLDAVPYADNGPRSTYAGGSHSFRRCVLRTVIGIAAAHRFLKLYAFEWGASTALPTLVRAESPVLPTKSMTVGGLQFTDGGWPIRRCLGACPAGLW